MTFSKIFGIINITRRRRYSPSPFFILEVDKMNRQRQRKKLIFDSQNKILNFILQMETIPEDYVLVGTQAEQKKYIGNAVEVTIARVWCEALVKKIIEIKKVA